jgi:hypothetical protein
MPIMDWVRGVWTSQDQRPVPEFKDAIFAKNKPKTGSINSGIEDQTIVSESKMVVLPCHANRSFSLRCWL